MRKRGLSIDKKVFTKEYWKSLEEFKIKYTTLERGAHAIGNQRRLKEVQSIVADMEQKIRAGEEADDHLLEKFLKAEEEFEEVVERLDEETLMLQSNGDELGDIDERYGMKMLA